MRVILLAALTVTLGAVAPPGIRDAPALLVPRAVHTATLLPDGNVLIAGGCTVDGCELADDGRTTEIYNSGRRQFVAGPRLTLSRVGHAATLLADGRVLVAGGWGPDGLTSVAELLDQSRASFVRTGSLRVPRGAFTATRLRDGRVLFAGGARDGRDLASAELYDPRTGLFKPTGSMRQARNAHAAALLRDGRVLVVGGASAGKVLAGAEAYDPRTGRWSAAGRMRVARHKLAAVVLAGGKVLVVGGSSARDWFGRHPSAELFDPQRRSFTFVSPMQARRFKLSDAVVRLRSGQVLVAGGGAAVELYDPRRRRFHAVGQVGSAWHFSTATMLGNGSALIAGGYDDDIRVTRRAWLYR